MEYWCFITAIILIITNRYIGNFGTIIISLLVLIIEVILDNELIIFPTRFIEENMNLNYWIILNNENIMIKVLNIITVIVMIFSVYYLYGEDKLNIFIILILFFKFAMYLIILTNNIYYTFIGWEMVGILSFSLISYWSSSIINIKSSFKAFILNKIGDISFLLYIITYSNSMNSLCASNYLLILAALVKCAQLFFHGWLSDAMVGPTPVSALLHASTMVIAGILLLIKTQIHWNQDIIDLFRTDIYLSWAIFTIILASIIAYNQFDIKRIIAFSTCAQVGLMIFSQLNWIISFNHLITHAFFKALLFILAGYFIHLDIKHSQDIRKLSNNHYLSQLFIILFLFSLFTLSGLPTTSGFFSKEAIIASTLQFNTLGITILILIGSILSNLYNLYLYNWINNNSFQSLKLNSFKFNSLNKWLLLSILFIFILYYYTLFGKNPYNLDLIDNIIIFEFYLTFSPYINIIIFLPILFSIFLYQLCNSYFNLRLKHILLYGFNRKLYIDILYNYYILYPIWTISYKFIYYIIEKGWLENKFK